MLSRQSERTLKVALVGKYVVLPDAYLSVIEAIRHAAMKLGVAAHVSLMSSDELEKCDDEQLSEKLSNMDALVVPGGFGARALKAWLRCCGTLGEQDAYFGSVLGNAGHVN